MSKLPRPAYKTLNNAVVLAPFYTLKKCFQSKLMDIYVQEKLKRINHKTKMAKNRNMSFEYDVVQLNSELSKKKKHGKKESRQQTSSKLKKKDGFNVSKNYCKCDESVSNQDGHLIQNNKYLDIKGSKCAIRPLVIGTNLGDDLTCSHTMCSKPCYEGNSKKKRKIDSRIAKMSSLKPHDLDFVLAKRSARSNRKRSEGSNTSLSDASSKIDSWETYSDTFSCKEEHLEGSLAISTTSFDSCLEQVDKTSGNCSEINENKSRRSKFRTRFKPVEEMSDKGNIDVGLPTVIRSQNSRHLIISLGTKNSDDRINDFYDRDPESNDYQDNSQNVQSLSRICKTKKRRQTRQSSEPARTYNLRSSKNSSNEDLSLKNSSMINITKQDCRILLSPQKEITKILNKTLTIQNPIPMLEDKSYTEKNNNNSKTFLNDSKNNLNGDMANKETLVLFKKPGKFLEESCSQTDEFTDIYTRSLDNANAINIIAQQESKTSISGSKISLKKCNVPNVPVDGKQSDKNVMEKIEENNWEEREEKEEEEDNKIENTWCEKPKEISLTAHETANELLNESLPEIERDLNLQESSEANDVVNQPEDKEFSFIFGSQNSSSMMNSCKFTFGNNWVFSDEEDPEGKDRFL
ncbi:conserved hypothetical protein [Pediculus humanus corporis]|uniref:Uncharacterized protein n=1 Tax=Pediculus humanus subsp. corporis TaxID=121224 RepID=E0VTS1_PEDHC|nr:uncharacterized protein Phum_PHUM436860 [Pediculus humanus corporis]EEB16777.1 conserved hypothetical protein [Pediculus humanus corporis]